MNKAFKILQPKYYSKFQCDPIKCHESCCERWKIIIDKSTYEKYIQSENKIIKEIVKTGLSINEESINDDDFAIINLNTEMACPFLNQDNLCEIFINIGESNLSKTCKSYPRAIILLEDKIERGLEMSCSVACELALLNENGIEFDYIMDTVNFNDMYVVTPSIDLREKEIINEIKTSVIDILQIKTINLSEKVALVGEFLNQIVGSNNSLSHSTEETLSRIEESKSLFKQGKVGIQKIHNIDQNKQSFHHLNNILSMKFKKGNSISFFSKRYVECLMEVLDAFEGEDEEFKKSYTRNYEKNLKPYLDKKSYILENFLVNYVFIYGIELFKPGNIWTSYLKLCVTYGLLKFNLIGLATYNEQMNDDLALKLIQSLAKTIIQDKKYWQSVIKYLEEEKLDEYTKLITLILD
ncbi:MAG: hypothetical protein FH753_07040 [Firmicutes bacterium]|nr:hypothetical protein [Bacillota bacterium]